jgi:DNA-binding winged helix-turn-helix (wHTH) protein/tetratricopeptide (TPR) repeat protein
MASLQVRYRFGLFEADPATGELSKQAKPVRLQDQPFQLLVALLKANGAVVTREELRQQLWREDTFVEFDKSLGVALAKLRAALGDEAANPRFIETIPKRGYRFVAPLTVVPGESIEGPSSQPVIGAPATASLPVVPPLGQHRVALATAAVILIAGLGAFFLLRPTAAPHLTARAGVVVATFTNATGDNVFDGSLRTVAMMGLAQSPYLNVLSDSALGSILQGLGRPPNEALTPGLAREACRRASAAAIVDGSIARSASSYILTVEASRCSDGSVLAEARDSAGRRDQIVATLGREIASVRERLGEPGATLQSYNAPLEVATTDSLEALRAYQLGMELRARADNLKAIPALKTAIALDPQFAAALVQLGSSYSNMGNVAEGTVFFRRAFELRDRATAPERFLIAGRYFDIVIGDLEKASETYTAWSEVYPDNWLGFNALANDSNLMGRYEIAATASRRTVALEPNHAFGYANLITGLLGSGRFDDAKAACRQALEHFPDGSTPHLALHSIAVFEKDAAASARELSWSTAHADRPEVLFEQAEWSTFRGRPVEAARMFDEVARRERAQGNSESPADALVNGAEFEALMGRTDAATKTADEALQIAHNEVVLGLGALVYTLGGRDAAAERLLQEAAEHHPLSTMTMGVYSPTARAVIAGQRHGATVDDVTRALSAGVPYEWGQEAALAPRYVYAWTCLRLHAWDEAARAFQDVIAHAGVDPISPIGPLSYLGLARADAALGRRDDSRKAYAAVLEFWKDAEPDFALLAAARREYAALAL